MKKLLAIVVVMIVMLMGLTGCDLQETINDKFEEKMMEEAFGVSSIEELIEMEMMESEDVLLCNAQSTVNGSYIVDVYMKDGSEIQMIMDSNGEVSTYVFE